MIRFLLAFSFVALAAGSYAQTTSAPLTPAPADMTAAQVFDKYYAALGGKDKLLTVTDLTTEMSTETNGNAMIMTRYQKLPNKSSMNMNAMGMIVFKIVTDGTKVQRGGMQGNAVVEGDEAKRTIAMSTLFAELHYAENGVTSQLAGIEQINNKGAYKVVNTVGALSWTDYYDTTSGLKVQSVSSQKSPRGEFSQTSTFSDFKAVNGIQFPMTVTQASPRGPMTLAVDAVKVNKGVKDSEFVVK